MSDIPSDLKYAKSHEWCRIEGKIATVGISDYAQSELGDVVYAELVEAGTELARGASIGSLESVKSVSDIYAPVGGKIIEINPALEDTPEVINSDPYDDGWILKIEISDPSELESLMDAAKYRESIGE